MTSQGIRALLPENVDRKLSVTFTSRNISLLAIQRITIPKNLNTEIFRKQNELFSLTVSIVYFKTHPFLTLFVVTPYCILRFHLFKLPNYTSRRTDEIIYIVQDICKD